ncbi:hypothetical protein ACTXG6_17030 [Pseudonocardia sp. Cha107L01]|uniref:hypothetical protein n=1 Tax=Pseudonocardia sp. Cha107L01 TaxID=3457576 RepID=UPI00403EDBFF
MLDQRVLDGYVPLRARTAYFDALGGAEVRRRARSPADGVPPVGCPAKPLARQLMEIRL